jgi:hypothetical protein
MVAQTTRGGIRQRILYALNVNWYKNVAARKLLQVKGKEVKEKEIKEKEIKEKEVKEKEVKEKEVKEKEAKEKEGKVRGKGMYQMKDGFRAI